MYLFISSKFKFSVVVSNAYVKSPRAEGHKGFSAGSYRDLTRVARLDECMWTKLFMGNRDYLLDELQVLVDNLSDFLKVLKDGDEENMIRLLRRGRELKETAGGN